MCNKLKPFERCDFYKSFAQSIIWSKKQLSIGQPTDDEANNAPKLDFPQVTARVRKVLEHLDVTQLGSEEMKRVLAFYGPNWFKCCKTYCRYFYLGFKNKAERDRHEGRHDRPWICTIQGCPVAILGYPSKTKLQSHMQEAHHIITDGHEFPDIQGSNANDWRRSRERVEPKIHQCDYCPRTFTQKFNLRSHMLSHTGERPFLCSKCQNTFFRKSDAERHARTIHTLSQVEAKKAVTKTEKMDSAP